MNVQYRAIKEVHDFFTKEGIKYVIIGGIALQKWGEPRFTRDLDFTILVKPGEEEKVIKKILSVFSPRISDALNFALKNRICLVKSSDGYEIDISLGILGYEEELIRRAKECKISKRYSVKVCSAEDLIIHKTIAGRPRDQGDIEGIILRQGNKLNIRYIRKWLKRFSEILQMPEIIDRFEEIRRKTS